MASIDTIVIGTSAGGVEALTRLVKQLPADLAAAVFVVIHFPESSTSVLPKILSRHGEMPAKHGENEEMIQNGQIYVAPPGMHMLLHDDRIVLVRGPRENGNRPAIDPLFRSAAHSRGARVVSVLLTGLLDDGTLGTSSVNRHGGISIAQDPDDAMFGDMPKHAIQSVGVRYVLPLDAIGRKLAELVGNPAPESPIDEIMDPVQMNLRELQDLESRGRPSAYVCPECQGTLFELEEDGVFHFRCRVGHSYLPDSLVTSQGEALESALWAAMRAIKEHNALLARMYESAAQRGYTSTARNYQLKLEEGVGRLELIRRVLGVPSADEFEPVHLNTSDSRRSPEAE